MTLSGQIEIPIQRPKCRHTIKKRRPELQRQQQITCGCGVTFDVDPASFKTAAKALDDFQKALPKFGK